MAWGLKKDIINGGCKCAASNASWKPDPVKARLTSVTKDQHWSCYCNNPDLYMAHPAAVAAGSTFNDLNRKACGITLQCQEAGIDQQKTTWKLAKSVAYRTKSHAEKVN